VIKIGLEDYSNPIEIIDHIEKVDNEIFHSVGDVNKGQLISDNLVKDFYESTIKDRLPLVSPEYTKATGCIYTVTKDWGFIIDQHPDNEQALIISACSGHGFKHSPAIGELAAQWVNGEAYSVDVTAFKRLSNRKTPT
jgi:sarcosine oxidase